MTHTTCLLCNGKTEDNRMICKECIDGQMEEIETEEERMDSVQSWINRQYA